MFQRFYTVPLLLLATPAIAQTQIGPGGVRSGRTTIDATGVHTSGADVTSSGVSTARGGGLVILTNGRTRSVDCHGGRLTVNGNRNHLNVARCAAVVIAGNGNDVTARFSASGRISVPGNKNNVTWRASNRATVGISSLGTGNRVVRM